MSELHHEIHIEAPPERVWGILADLEAVRHYNPKVAAARRISPQAEGIGAGRECDLKPKGKVKERVIGWEPGTAVTMELYESDWPVRDMRWTTRLQPAVGGTRVFQDLSYRPKGALGAVLDAVIMKRMMDRNIAEVFAGLKRFAETGA